MNTTKEPTHKQGEIVMIFQDPITQQKPEEKGKLVKFIQSDDGLEEWDVRFLLERRSYRRHILAKSEAAE